jgi:hypothetical protein
MVEQTALAVAISSVDVIANKPAEGDYSFLQEGRKQTEERLDCRYRAPARVKSMVQHAEMLGTNIIISDDFDCCNKNAGIPCSTNEKWTFSLFC